MQNSRNTYNHIFTLKIYLHSGHILHPATVYLCSLKELYLFNFKEMINLLTVKEIHSKNIYLFTRSTQSFEAVLFFHGIIFISRNLLVHSRKCILVQGKHNHSGKLYPFEEIYSLRNIYSLKFKAICSFKETIFIEYCCVRGNSRNIYSKIVPSHFMIIISFANTLE